MNIASIATIKKELQHLSSEELISLCIRLSKFKKENKELMNYELFLENDKSGFIEMAKKDIDDNFHQMNKSNFHLIKKSVRRIFRETKKLIRITADKEIEVELLIYLCKKLSELQPSVFKNSVLSNLFYRTVDQINKKIEKLHEDLQYDFSIQLDTLEQ